MLPIIRETVEIVQRISQGDKTLAVRVLKAQYVMDPVLIRMTAEELGLCVYCIESNLEVLAELIVQDVDSNRRYVVAQRPSRLRRARACTPTRCF